MAVKKDNRPINADENVDNSTGVITYANEVVAIMAGVAASEVEGIAGMCTSGGLADIIGRNRNITRGVKVEVGTEEASVDLYVIMEYGKPIQRACSEVQENVRKNIESMTGLHVVRVDVHVQGVSFEKENRDAQRNLETGKVPNIAPVTDEAQDVETSSADPADPSHVTEEPTMFELDAQTEPAPQESGEQEPAADAPDAESDDPYASQPDQDGASDPSEDAPAQEPIIEAEAPIADAETPDADAEAPAADAEAPDAEAEAPDADAEAPAADAEAPDAEAEAPDADAEAPVENTEEIQPETNAKRPASRSKAASSRKKKQSETTQESRL